MTTTRIIQAVTSGKVVPDALQIAPTSVQIAQPREPLVTRTSRCAEQEKRRLLRGHVVAVAGDGAEEPVADALVELHAIDPLRTIETALSAPVLGHLRALLRDGFAPVDLYRHVDHVFDAPTISIADIHLTQRIPGYELLVSAARLRSDAAFRKLLCNYLAILRPLLCYYHPCSFASHRVATVMSDDRGAFRFPVLRREEIAAQPGYYFVVRRQISPHLFATLYEPMPVTWHAYWEDADEEPIRLATRHPLALHS